MIASYQGHLDVVKCLCELGGRLLLMLTGVSVMHNVSSKKLVFLMTCMHGSTAYNWAPEIIHEIYCWPCFIWAYLPS